MQHKPQRYGKICTGQAYSRLDLALARGRLRARLFQLHDDARLSTKFCYTRKQAAF